MSAIQNQIRNLLEAQYAGSALVGGARKRKSTSKSAGHLSEWQMHVRHVRASHPGMSQKEAMQVASKTYHRTGAKGGALVGGARVGGALVGGYGTKKGAKKAVLTKQLKGLAKFNKLSAPKSKRKSYEKLYFERFPAHPRAPKRKMVKKKTSKKAVSSKGGSKSFAKKVDDIISKLKALKKHK